MPFPGSVCRFAGLALALACVTTPARAQSPRQADGPGAPRAPVTLPGTEVRTLHSTATCRDYDLYIAFPGGYTPNPSTKYPVVYILDGQWDFKLMASVYGGLVYDRWVPPMMLVGITYSGTNPSYDSLRAMDYTPVHTANVAGSGDGPKFLSFLKDQVIPLIESSYPADPSRRALLGASYGGLFTLYTLFAQPTLFSRYIAGSPAVPYADNFVFKEEADYFAHHHELPARVWIAVGDAEPLLGPDQAFIKVLQSRHYRGLTLGTRVIEGERHSGNKPESFNRGLRSVFAGD